MNDYLKAAWERMARTGKLELDPAPVEQSTENEQETAACRISERFLLAGAQLPEGEVLGWQVDLKDLKNHLFSSSEAVSREDLNWIFRPLGHVRLFGRGRTGPAEARKKDRSLYVISSVEGGMRDSVRFQNNYGYDFYIEDEGLYPPGKEAVSELFEMLSESDAMIRLMAGPVADEDPGSGMILISLRGEMSLRMKTLLSQVFPRLAAIDPITVAPEDQNSLCLPNKYFLNAMTAILKTVMRLTQEKPFGKAAGGRKRRSAGKAARKDKNKGPGSSSGKEAEEDSCSDDSDDTDIPQIPDVSDFPDDFNMDFFLDDFDTSEDPDDPGDQDERDIYEPYYLDDPDEEDISGKGGGSGSNLLPNPDYAGDETKIDDLGLTVRSYNCLRRAGINTVGDLAKWSEEDLEHVRNLGKKSFQEVLEIFRKYVNDPGHRPRPEKISGSAAEVEKSYLESLDELTGLTEVKKQLKRIAALARLKKDMKEQGREAGDFSLNMEFIGNPGTAKTTVARIAAGLFHEAGLLATDNFVEVGRADLIARYEGQTAEDVRRVFDRADGKVLFIDEAYSLLESHQGEFGDEAINTIVQEMENRRDRTVVIFAGYPDKMEEFFQRNPGLRSRVPFTLRFEDYSEDELAQIAGTEAARRGFSISEEAAAALHEACLYASSHPEMGNGRFARNLVENAIMSYAERTYQQTDTTPKADQRDFTLISSDFSLQYKKTEAERRPLGFRPEKKAG